MSFYAALYGGPSKLIARTFKQYYSKPNTLMPNVVEYGKLGSGFVYELSSGMVNEREIFGITVLRREPGGAIMHYRELSKITESKEDAREYIQSKRKELQTQGKNKDNVIPKGAK